MVARASLSNMRNLHKTSECFVRGFLTSRQLNVSGIVEKKKHSTNGSRNINKSDLSIDFCFKFEVHLLKVTDCNTIRMFLALSCSFRRFAGC